MEPAYKESFVESRCKVDDEGIKRLKAQLMDTPQRLDMERVKVLTWSSVWQGSAPITPAWIKGYRMK
jgi:hypothetical protein